MRALEGVVPLITFMGTGFHDVTMEESLGLVDEYVRSGLPHRIFSANVACLVEAKDDPFMRSFYKGCDLLTVDGMGVLYAGKLLGYRFRETVATSYLTLRLLEEASKRSYRIYLLGSKPAYLRLALQHIQDRYPGVDIVGSHHGYFAKEDEPLVVKQIANLRPDILLIGISTPLKEQFVFRNFSELNAAVQIGVGGTIDVLAGVIRLPPPWIRIIGMEWVFRLSQEPRRFWKRYCRTNLIFSFLVARECVHRCLGYTSQKVDHA
jgi:N-acetylglucosaminyldiphosphoundecaprenol N-acetyl-beta-D-mannosaminyltransferase